MDTMLVSLSIWIGLLTGVFLGLAHLTKASVLPGFSLFALFMLLRWISSKYQPDIRGAFSFSMSTYKNSTPVGLLIVGISFFGVIGPYIMESKTNYGKYFYNVNSTFYIISTM